MTADEVFTKGLAERIDRSWPATGQKTPDYVIVARAFLMLLKDRNILKQQQALVFKAGWQSGYSDGGEHDCRMFTPTDERALEDWIRHGKPL